MRRIIDLSHPLSDGMPVFPGDPGVSFGLVHTIKDTGYHVTRICMGSHSGTHIDAPQHCLLTDKSVDGLSLDALVGWAEVLDLGERNTNSDITTADLDLHANRVYECARLLIRTGWSSKWGQPGYYTDFPGLTMGAATWLVNRKVKLVAFEQPSVDRTQHSDVHKTLLAANIVLIESVANLGELTQDRVYITALPLKLVGLDGSPVRMIAIEGIDVSEV